MSLAAIVFLYARPKRQRWVCELLCDEGSAVGVRGGIEPRDIRYKVLWIGKIAKQKGIGETKVLRKFFLYRNSGFRTKVGELIILNWMVMESEIRRMNDSG